jgi:putative ATP-dependent endonuclease of the OLD family
MQPKTRLNLCRILVENYKSIRIADLEQPNNLTIFVGKNNSGKSNLLDALYFLKQATISLKAAVDLRGTGLRDLILRKSEVPVHLVLSFDIPPDTRRWLLDKVFAGASQLSPEAAFATSFLNPLDYRLTFTADQFQEELSTGHPISQGEDICLLKIAGNVTVNSVYLPRGGLPLACQSLPANRANTIPLTATMSSGGACLGLRAAKQQTIPEPSLAYLVDAVSDEIEGIEWISPIRRSQAALGLSEQTELDAEASNLAGVLHTLYVNDRTKFETVLAEAQRIAPSLLDIVPRVSGSTTVLSFRERGEPENVRYRLDQVSFGLRTALAIMTKVLCAKPGSWVCLEEPETHLHPEAQAVLYDFLQRESQEKRIFAATHSSVFASLAPIECVWLVKRSEEQPWSTEICRVDSNSTDTIIRELGVKPSYNFEADAVVFIEDKLGTQIYDVWAEKEGLGGRVQFIGAEGWNNMEYFANAKIIRSRRVETEVFVIFDGDTDRGNKNKKIKERLVAELGIPETHVLTLGQSELEGYLLDPVAILDAFPELPRSVSKNELEEFLAVWRGRRDQKRAFDELFKTYGLGRFDAERGAEIARSMQAPPKDLVMILRKIKKEIGLT